MKQHKGYWSLMIIGIILCVLFFLGWMTNSTNPTNRMEDQKVYHSQEEDSRLEYLITQLIEKVSNRLTKTTEVVAKAKVFGRGEHSIVKKIPCLFYIKYSILFCIISSFYQIISYIHKKDGPKSVFSPTTSN